MLTVAIILMLINTWKKGKGGHICNTSPVVPQNQKLTTASFVEVAIKGKFVVVTELSQLPTLCRPLAFYDTADNIQPLNSETIKDESYLATILFITSFNSFTVETIEAVNKMPSVQIDFAMLDGKKLIVYL